MGVKRKERDEDVVDTGEESGHGSTVFVSNLPYQATSTDVETLFSDFAPVRNAFVVLDRESKVSKGVGYVTFALKEDAERVMKDLAESGIQLLGRNIRVQWAEKKPDPDATVSASVPKRPRKVPSTPSAPPDSSAIRTIVISGLPESIDSKVLWKKVRKFQGAEKVELPVNDADGNVKPGVAHALFDSYANALAASEGLHAHIYKGSLLSAVLKKRLDTAGKAGKGPNRAGRLIVRNLPWHATEQDLRTLFLPIGPVHSIDLPSEPSDTKSSNKSRGFAFVWMLSKDDAAKAISEVNGKVVGKRDGKEGRVVAVDWALSKDKWVKEMEAIVDGEELNDETEGDAPDQDNSAASEKHISIDPSASGDSDIEDDETEDEDQNFDSPDGEEEEPIRPLLPTTDTGTTLFIRNIPFEATDEDLRLLFRTYGPLRYARITMDHDSGRSRGTGFVCFWNKEHADKAIADAELLNAQAGTSTPMDKKTKTNPFSMPSILTPDPSSSLAAHLVLQGRTLSVIRAVPRDEATKLKDLGLKQREKADKRNLYLMREGVIFPNTPAAETISATELDRRVTSFNTRRALLRSNPSLYISKTRLSVRQLPTFATDRTLKRLAIHAVREFEKEVAAGSRTSLSQDELEEAADEPEKPALKKRPGERMTAVSQAKIVRQTERVDSLTGKGRSKGYGFLEMRSHADALRVLRWTNNNLSVVPLMTDWWKAELKEMVDRVTEALKDAKDQRDSLNDRLKKLKARVKEMEDERDTPAKKGKPIVLEFSIENIQVVKRRKELIAIGKEGSKKRKDIAEDPDVTTPPAREKRRRFDETLSASARVELNDKPTSDGKEGKKALRVSKTGEHSLGSIIGKKRKERRAKKAGR